MKAKTFILFFLTAFLAANAQEMTSKGDKYFYMYAFKQAIAEYQKELASGKLISNHQQLNLADAYFRTGDYKNASKIYVDINKKEDSIISANRFNMMLQSLSKISEPERVKAFLNTRKDALSNELLDNAEFNFELLESNANNGSNVEIFNSNGNSAQADFSPSFYKDKLLFSSDRPQKAKKVYQRTGQSYLDIYVARIDSNSGRIQNPNKFDGIPDSKYHKSTPHYSEGLDRMFYILSNTENGEMIYDDNGKNALAIGQVYDNGFFRFMLRDLGTSFYYPFFDEATGKLYFAADFDGGYGGTDIYYVYTNNGQIMSEPVNLGPRINSPGNEIAPFIYDGSMYFSSDIFYGLGGMDVYKSNMRSDEAFSIPVNIGKGINSEQDDFGMIIRNDDEKGLMGYFASNRPGGQGNDDIWGFSMSQKPGLRTFAMKGKVVNLSTNEPISGAHVRLTGKDGKIKDLKTNDAGDFWAEIPWQDEITIYATKNKHSVFTATYADAALDEVQQSVFMISIVALEDLLTEVEDKTVLNLQKFFFVRGKADLTPAITAELAKVVDAISRFPHLQLAIETHTDSRGNDTTNKRLSQKRADAIKGYLLNNGVPESNITETVGYGEERIVNNCTNGVYCLDFLHQQNSRTLFVITNAD